MQINDANNLQQGKSHTPLHSSVADDVTRDAEAREQEQMQNKTNPVQPQRISRDAAEKGITPDADPDDPVSP